MLVIAKEPLPGRVKTRLTPPFSPRAGGRAGRRGDRRHLGRRARCARGRARARPRRRPRALGAPGLAVVGQVGGGLDARLAAAFAAAHRPAVLVGMDTPQLRPPSCRVPPDRFDACIGLAADGGYWAIGFADPAEPPDVIPGVPMSRADTGARQCRRIRAAGLSLQILDELVDVDTAGRGAREWPCWRLERSSAAAGQVNPGAAEMRTGSPATCQPCDHVPHVRAAMMIGALAPYETSLAGAGPAGHAGRRRRQHRPRRRALPGRHATPPTPP